ncbi:MAG: phage minor head protein [Citrobacter sp.]|uniref:phage head morphogenesis protein n=1 Tax=Citrobacter sp. TaxID=1896336 RepID=UPI002FCAD4CD
MALTEGEISALFTMAPDAALRWLNNKGLRIRGDAESMGATDHAHAFGFANLARLDIAQDIVNGLRDALANGQTVRQFQDALTPLLKKKGWWGTDEKIDLTTGEITQRQMGNPARLSTIFRTELQGAYAAGRYESMLANAANRPYWRYVAVMDMRTRPAHARLHNRIFHYLDPIWKFIFPPNGFNCRCRVEALTEAEVTALGLVISKTDSEITQQVMTDLDDAGNPVFTPVNGVRFTAPDGQVVSFFPDVGFDRNSAREVWRANLDRYDTELARPYVAAGLAGPELGEMLKAARAGEQNGEQLAAAVLTPADATAFSLKSRTAWLTEHQLAQQLRRTTLPSADELPMVQHVIESAVVVTRDDNTVMFFSPREAGGWYAVTLDAAQRVSQFITVADNALSGLLIGNILRDLR